VNTSVVRAAIYCRISSDRGEERLGVDRQEADCRSLCAAKGWTAVEPPYVDNNISAADPRKRRPAYDRLMRDVLAGLVDAVVVYDLDRLHRRPAELERFFEAVDEAGVRSLASVAGDVDLADGNGLMMARIKGAVAAEEVRKTVARVRRKKLEIAQAGRWSGGGTRPFGFEKDGVTHRPAEVALMQDAAQRVLRGESLRSIRERWNREGVEPAYAERWSVTCIRRMLIGPRIAGLRQHQGEVIGKAVWDPVVDEETWRQLRAVLTDPSRRQAPPSREYPLYPLARCALCGRQLTATPTRDNRLYGCRKESGGCGSIRVTAGPFEAHVLGVVLSLADSPGALAAIRLDDQEREAEVRRLVVELAELERRRHDLATDRYQADLPREIYLPQEAHLRSRVSAASAQLSRLRGTDVVEHGESVSERWAEMEPERRKAVLASLVKEIRVHRAPVRGLRRFDRRRVEIVWRYGALSEIAQERLRTASEEDLEADEATYLALTELERTEGIAS
jgi:site-specific DNA recombinase